jgi:hypothetical protein
LVGVRVEAANPAPAEFGAVYSNANISADELGDGAQGLGQLEWRVFICPRRLLSLDNRFNAFASGLGVQGGIFQKPQERLPDPGARGCIRLG